MSDSGAEEKNIIRLAGRKYHGETGQLINDAVKAPRPSNKTPKAANTLNRQYVHRPDIRRAASIKTTDNRAQKPQIKQFNRDIIKPSEQGPKAPGVTRFRRGDFNQTDKPIILDVKPNKDIVVTVEQNQKFIEAVERAKRVDFARRYYAAQISRQRRRKAGKIYQTSQNLAKKTTDSIKSPKKTSDKITEENQRARKDQVINQAIAKTPSNKQLIEESPHIRLSYKAWFKKHLTSISVIIILIIATAGLLYLNWPNIALNLANRQLGITGHIPTYVVDGFKLDGYPNVSNQNLILNYRNQSGDTYKIIQTKRSLDSQSVLVEIIKPKAGDEYSIHRQDGLTIYVFFDKTEDKTKAIWSNGGVLYQISANETFLTKNLYRLATSL